MTMVLATAPLGLVGVTPTLLLFQQPFGINALVGLIALSGILMRNTLILIGQIRQNEKDGLAPFAAVVEATVQRSRPVILTALAAMLAFIPLTYSVFWGTLAYTLIGGTFAGTVLTLVFLPALYAIWFKIKPVAEGDVSDRFLSKRKRAAVPAPALAPIQGGSGDVPSGEGERL
jgi:multidrug efflux pump subunit AcrB